VTGRSPFLGAVEVGEGDVLFGVAGADIHEEGHEVEVVEGDAEFADGFGFGDFVFGELVVVAGVGEVGVGVGADEVAEFAVEGGAEAAVAVDAADEVLVAGDAGDEGGGDGGGGFEEGDFVFVAAGRFHAGADGEEGDLVGAGGPLHVVFGEGGLEVEEEGGVVVGRDAAVLEGALDALGEFVGTVDGDDLWGEVGGGGGGGADELPEGEFEVAAGGALFVVFGVGVDVQGGGGGGCGISGEGALGSGSGREKR